MNTKDFIQLLTNKMDDAMRGDAFQDIDDYFVYLVLRNELLEIEMEEKRLGLELVVLTPGQIAALDAATD